MLKLLITVVCFVIATLSSIVSAEHPARLSFMKKLAQQEAQAQRDSDLLIKTMPDDQWRDYLKQRLFDNLAEKPVQKSEGELIENAIVLVDVSDSVKPSGLDKQQTVYKLSESESVIVHKERPIYDA